MLYHVTVTYPRDHNPTLRPDGVRGLVSYARWMSLEAEHPAVTPYWVYWGMEEPQGYALIDAPGDDELRAYLAGLPPTPSIAFQRVSLLREAEREGLAFLATRPASVLSAHAAREVGR